jgi:hypothetical protein
MSGSVFVNNLDDFIAPSQACVNPFVNGTNPEKPVDPHLVSINKPSKKHRITLEPEDFQFDSDYMSDYPSIIQSFAAAPIPQVEPNLIKQRVGNDSKTVATVSLNDCLACNGCVTSAEAVLIQEQSSQRFLQLLEEQNPDITIVVQISPNSRSSIAQFLGLTKEEFFLKVASIFKAHGVKYVLDSASGADVALVESREEFVYR